MKSSTRLHPTGGRGVEIKMIIKILDYLQCVQVSSLATFDDGKLTIVQTAKTAGEKSTTVDLQLTTLEIHRNPIVFSL